MGTTADLLDDVANLLRTGIKTQDPKIVATANQAQRSYFISMSRDELLFIRDLLASYTNDEKQGCTELLLVIERELNDTYVTWLCGGSTECATPAYMVRNIIYLVPHLLALSVPLRLPAEKVSSSAYVVLESTPDVPVEVLAGKIIAAELTGRTDLGYSDEHLRWISSHRDALLPFAERLRTAGSVDRVFYESLVESHSAVTEGVL